MELVQRLCDVSIFIYLFIFYIEINNNSKSYTLHAQEILFPSDIYPRGWTKLSGVKSSLTLILCLFDVDKTPPFHCLVGSLDCYPAIGTEFVSTR